MLQLKIDGVTIEVDEGATLLDAALQAGASVPTLCYERRTGALTSCMLCVVRDVSTGRLMPACSTRALDGMVLDTRGEEVRAARREILRLLLNEHVGDCEGPCSSICSASLNIPRMLRYIAEGDPEAAARLAKRDLIFPATLGRLCSAPCEKACRRGSYDTPISIRRLHGETAELQLSAQPTATETAAKTGKRVTVVGAGLAGLSAAYECLQVGHDVRVYEKAAMACPALHALSPEQLPPEILDAEIASIQKLGAELVLSCEVGTALPLARMLEECDALILACSLSCEANGKIFLTKEDVMPVRAVAHGKAAAARADAFLSGCADLPPEPFTAQIGRLHPEEKNVYGVERLNTPPGGVEDNRGEAARCLHCDCLNPVSCKLRRYAEEYGLGPKLKRGMNRPVVQTIQRHDDVLFEPGKCIKCGICVEISRAANEAGLAFEGRGLSTRVHAPFDGALGEALGSAALECVRACPTGALSLRNEEERS